MAEPSNQSPGWVERLVSVAAALGFNPVRVRWKLHLWERRLQQSRNEASATVAHVRYAHKHCGACGRLVDAAERVCPACGARVSSRFVQVLARLGLALPQAVSASALLGFAMIAVYARLIVAQGGGGLFDLEYGTLVRFGGHVPELVRAGEAWRLLTPMFLHIGLWHLGFNVLALLQVGPSVEQLYGRGAMLLLFVITGVAGNVASNLLGLHGVSAGASGAIMGLIGIAAGWGHRDGTSIGRGVRDRMLQWALYTIVFGYFIGADNAAHGGGLVAGLVLGFAFRPSRRGDLGLRAGRVAVGVLGGGAAVAGIALTLWPPAGARAADFGSAEAAYAKLYRRYGEMCRLAGDERVAAFQALMSELEDEVGAPTAEQADAACRSLDTTRSKCIDFERQGLSAFLPEGQRQDAFREETERIYRGMCSALRE